MKKVNVVILVLLNLIITSCSSTDETQTEEVCVTENHVINLDKYIKRINYTSLFSSKISSHNYAYNEFNLLAEKESYKGQTYNTFFNYQCNNNLSSREENTFTYNLENQLTSFSTNSNFMDYQVSYNGNVATVVGTINSIENSEIKLELNSLNLITKVIRATSYTTFEYDLNGNITLAKDFNSDNDLLKAYEITYDQNPNPFYGQLSSIYLERFIFYFNTSAFYGIDYFFINDGFNFPYLKNNPLVLRELDCTGCFKILERIYTYDSEDYPIKFEEIYVGAPAIIYNLEY